MTTPMVAQQITQLEAAIAAQEALRPTLGDAAVDAVIATLREKLESLHREIETPASSAPLLREQLREHLQTYLPKELEEKMRAVGRIEGERKRVTVMFADLSGYTPLGERLDPEVVMALSQDLLKELAEVVYRYEGYIVNFMGDAVMAVFGAPIAHEDDPERALRAALLMRERAASLNRRWQQQLGEPLLLHIGINTGMAVTGTVGNELQLTYTVSGDTVNTAQRLQSIAQPGQILVSRDTYRLTQEAFTFTALEPIMVKGKREPVPVFELQRAKLFPGKARGLKELSEAFVGREREMAQLHAVLDELGQGRGHIVSINGEAGIGKSRLLAEWRKAIGERARWVEGRAFAHTTSLAYGPFLDLFRRYAGIKDDDSEAEARARLTRAVQELFPNNVEARAIFANLLAMRLTPEESGALANLAGEALRRRLFALFGEFFERLAQERPLIVVIEDIHWADQTSLDLIESLFLLVEKLPIALVGARRRHTDDRPSQLHQMAQERYPDRFTNISLTPLSDSSSLSMVEQLLATPSLPESLCNLILQKAEGNPFFVEEVIRALIERGALMRADGEGWTTTPLIETVNVPDTVQGVLMARLDSLPDETKWVVQQASVIGRIFLYRVLRQVSEQTASLDAELSQLEREELIRERARLPEIEYIFKHALTQEVAYQTLLAPRRKELHRRVGAALEVIFASRLGEFQSIIGEHFLRGEAWEKAADYLAKAGDAAARLYAHAEARVHYAHALEACSQLPDTKENDQRRVDLITKQVSVSILADGPEKSLERLAVADSIVKNLAGPDGTSGGDRLRQARVRYWQGRAHYLRNELREAIGLYQQVLAVGQEYGDEELLALPSSVIGRVLGVQGQFGKVTPLLNQAIPLLEKTGNWVDWIWAVGFQALSLAGRGYYEDGLAEGQRALARAEEMKYLTGIAASRLLITATHLMAGMMRRVLDESQLVLEVAEQSGDRLYLYLGHGFQAWANSELGNHAASAESVARRSVIAESLGGRLLLTDWFAASDATIALNDGNISQALTLAENAAGIAHGVGGIFAEGVAERVWGKALARLETPEWDKAEEHLAASVRVFESGENILPAAYTEVAWGIMSRDRGELTAAREHLEKAITQFQRSQLDASLAHAQQLLREAKIGSAIPR